MCTTYVERLLISIRYKSTLVNVYVDLVVHVFTRIAGTS